MLRCDWIIETSLDFDFWPVTFELDILISYIQVMHINIW